MLTVRHRYPEKRWEWGRRPHSRGSGRAIVSGQSPAPGVSSMRRLVALTATLLLASAANAFAQGESPKPDSAKAATHVGKWSGSVSTEQGSQEVWATIKKE